MNKDDKDQPDLFEDRMTYGEGDLIIEKPAGKKDAPTDKGKKTETTDKG